MGGLGGGDGGCGYYFRYLPKICAIIFGVDISYQVVPPTVSKVEFSIYIYIVSKLNVLSLCMTYILNLFALSFVETFII